MDRDPNENVLDPVERVSPPSGANDTGDVGGQEARLYEKRRRSISGIGKRGKAAKAKIGSQQDGEDPDRPTDRISEIAEAGLHGGGGDSAWRPSRRGD